LQRAQLESLYLNTSTTGKELYQQLIINSKINGKKARIIINSRATDNFITNTFIIKNHISYWAKEKPYKLTIIDKLSSNYRDE